MLCSTVLIPFTKLRWTVLQIGFVTGVSLAAILAVSFSSLATVFTQDAEVLGIVRTGVLVSIQISIQ